MNQKSNAIDEYLAQLEPARREALQTIRAVVHETVPGAKESMRYRMPTFELDEVICAMASQKHHVSLYVTFSAP